MRNKKLTCLLAAFFLTLLTVSIPVMGTVTPSSVELTLSPGASTVELKDVNITVPLMADVLFSFDVSDSNSGFLSYVKADMPGIIASLQNTGVDTNYGVSSGSDYPAFYNTCGYADQYGNADSPFYAIDYPYLLDLPITANTASVISHINGLAYGYGWDNPEDYARVFYESYADPNTGWRPGAKRVMVHFGDELPHDCDLNAGIPGATGTFSTGCDPGRDGVAGTPDDLDFQNVLDGMATNHVILIECTTDITYLDHWTEWAKRAGGEVYVTGETTVGDDVVYAMEECLTPPDVTNVHFEVEPGYENWVNSAWSYSGSDKIFNGLPFTFTVPSGTPAGDYTFKVRVVDDDGVIYGIQSVTIHVTVPSPVTVNRISPASGLNTTIVPIRFLGGTGFVNGAQVHLSMDGNPDIVASSVRVISPQKITCIFDLTGVKTGAWDVVVVNPDGGKGVLTNGFLVTSGIFSRK